MARFIIALVIHFLSAPMQGILRHFEDRTFFIMAPFTKTFLPIEIKTTEVTVAKWVVELFQNLDEKASILASQVLQDNANVSEMLFFCQSATLSTCILSSY